MPTEDTTALPLTTPTDLLTAEVTPPATTPDPFANIPVRDIFYTENRRRQFTAPLSIPTQSSTSDQQQGRRTLQKRQIQ